MKKDTRNLLLLAGAAVIGYYAYKKYVQPQQNNYDAASGAINAAGGVIKGVEKAITDFVGAAGESIHTQTSSFAGRVNQVATAAQAVANAAPISEEFNRTYFGGAMATIPSHADGTSVVGINPLLSGTARMYVQDMLNAAYAGKSVAYGYVPSGQMATAANTQLGGLLFGGPLPSRQPSGGVYGLYAPLENNSFGTGYNVISGTANQSFTLGGGTQQYMGGTAGGVVSAPINQWAAGTSSSVKVLSGPALVGPTTSTVNTSYKAPTYTISGAKF